MASFLLNLGNYAKITIFMLQKQSNYKKNGKFQEGHLTSSASIIELFN